MRKLTCALLAALTSLTISGAHAVPTDGDAVSCVGDSGYSGGTWLFGEHTVFPPLLPIVVGVIPCYVVSTDDVPPVAPTEVRLTATGTFRCGKGTLSGTGLILPGTADTLRLTWHASFTRGIGVFSGTATQTGKPSKVVKGILVINDAPPGGRCNDTFVRGNGNAAMNIVVG